MDNRTEQVADGVWRVEVAFYVNAFVLANDGHGRFEDVTTKAGIASGEWAVAASLVAEIFPARARVHASGIFHASSVLGTWGATLTALAVGNEWRLAYVVGVVPALLTLWVRASVEESASWREAERRSRRIR